MKQNKIDQTKQHEIKKINLDDVNQNVEKPTNTTPRGNASTGEDTYDAKRLSVGNKTPKTSLSVIR